MAQHPNPIALTSIADLPSFLLNAVFIELPPFCLGAVFLRQVLNVIYHVIIVEADIAVQVLRLTLHPQKAVRAC
jgi:hypothetical protein